MHCTSQRELCRVGMSLIYISVCLSVCLCVSGIPLSVFLVCLSCPVCLSVCLFVHYSVFANYPQMFIITKVMSLVRFYCPP